MTDPAAILDYASPRKRGRFRLPATSTLTCDVGDDTVVVEQRLAGKAEAIAALAFGALTFALLVGMTVTVEEPRRSSTVTAVGSRRRIGRRRSSRSRLPCRRSPSPVPSSRRRGDGPD